MPLVDEESALSLPSPKESGLHDLGERDNSSSNLSGTVPQHEQPSTPMMASISATSSFQRHSSDTGQTKKNKAAPRLLHPILHQIPLNFRFGLYGFSSNALFMYAYNAAVVKFEHSAASSTIYAVVYLIFIPISHAIISLLVFGWPERYFRSLMSNAPVGLTAIVLGAALTAYLEQIEFNTWVAEAVIEYQHMLGHTNTTANRQLKDASAAASLKKEMSRGGGEFYSSLFVLVITGIWTFVLSVMVNAPAESLEKKEL